MQIHINLSKESLRDYYRRAKIWLWQPHRRPYTIVASTFLFVFLLILTKPSGESKDIPDPSHRIETRIVKPQPLATTLYLYGTIESPAKSTIVSTVTSNIIATPHKEGAMVAPGDILVSIDPIEPQFIAQQRSADVKEIEGLLNAENNRHEANLTALAHEQELFALQSKALERQENLVKQKLTSQASVDQAKHEVLKIGLNVNARELEIADHEARIIQLEARLSKARAQHALAELDLSRTQIVSSFHGRVAQLHVAALDRVSPGTPLMDIYDHDSLEIRAQIPHKYLSQVYEQLKEDKPIQAQARIDGQTVSLQLERLSGEVKSGQGGVDALFKVTQGHPHLSLGRPVDLLVSLDNQTPVIAIPYTALYSYDRVFKIVDNTLQGISVARFGERINDEGESELLITSNDLTENDVILTSLLPNATSGMKVHDK